jgi:hypothetical protein
MTAPIPPPGIDLTHRWGPHLFPGGKLYVFKGIRYLVPEDWKSPLEMIKHLKYIEQLEWKLALPHERQELFNRQFEVLTKGIPLEWKIVATYVVCGIIFAILVLPQVKHQISKL